jgi:hypothetical protein
MRKLIPQFTGINKGVHPRSLPDNQCADARNVYFKDGKVKSRFGYHALGNQLSGTVLGLHEFTKLRTDDSDLIGITENSTYQYNESTGVWDEFAASYNTGTVNQPDAEVEFNAATTTYISSCKLDDTHWAVAFRDEGDSNKGKVIIGTLDDGAITYGSEYEFNAGATTEISICCLGLDATLAFAYIVIAYADTTTGYGTCIAATVTLATRVVVKGTELAFNAYATTYTSITMLDATRFCVAFAANSKGSAVVSSVTLATNTIAAYGAVYDFNATAVTYVSLCMFDSTHIVVGYIDSDIHLKAHMGLVTLPTKIIDFTSYPEYNISAAAAVSSNICYIDSTHFAITADLNTYICIINLTTGNITYGSNQSPVSSFINFISMLDITHIIYTYRDPDNYYGKLKIGTISNTTISWGTSYTFKTADITIQPSISILTSSGFVVSFEDAGDSNHGTSMYYDRLGFKGSGTTWGTTWPDAVYDIKFGTNSLSGTGTPDVWYKIHQPESTTYLTLADDTLLDYLGNTLKLLSTGTNYIIRTSFLSSDDDYFDSCNIIEGLGEGDEKEVVFTNGVDPIKLFDGTTLSTLALNGDGTAPISLAKFCTYYHGHLIFAYVYDAPNWMPQTVQWSYRGQPTYWSTGSAGYSDLIQGDDKITGMRVLNQRLYILKEDSLIECYFTGQTDPAFEFIEDRVKGIGCPHGRTCINTGSMLIFKGKDNIYIFNGMQAVPIGGEVISDILVNEDPDYAHMAFASHLKKENLYCLHIVENGHTSTNLIYVLNYLKNSWTIWEFADDMTAFAVFGNNIVLGDVDGNVYELDYNDISDVAHSFDFVSRSVAENNSWASVCYGNGLYVAVAYSGTNRVMTSPDGITWTARVAAENNGWYSVCYGNGLYVAVAYSGTNRVMTSPDGITWTARVAAENDLWASVCYGNGLYVAVAWDGVRVMTSSDGITWTARVVAEANTWSSICYGNGLFVAVSQDGTNRVMTSSDGITWTARVAAEANTWMSICYGNGLFVAISINGTNRVMTSPDGITWTARVAAEANTWMSICYGNGLFVATAIIGTNLIMTSSNGINWNSVSAPEANTWMSICYGNSLFASVSYSGTNRVMTYQPDNSINSYIETKDFSFPDKNGQEFAIRLVESILTTETNAGSIQISVSLNYGDAWSTPIVINQNTTNSVYEHIQNWLQRGKTARFKVENVSGSKFATESLEIGYEQAGNIARI